MSPGPGSLFEKAAPAAFRLLLTGVRHAVAGLLGLVILYLSLLATSAPMSVSDRAVIDNAIAILDSKGFDSEAFLLRHTATFRSRDNWINISFPTENSFAATNFPFGIITIYPDFYTQADDTTRAMILLHEAQHMKGGSEADAYAYVWRNRQQLGWTQLSHGTTDTYVTVELETRELAPELFTCESKLWNDCTNDVTQAASRRVHQ
jgi:hypothetical protein